MRLHVAHPDSQPVRFFDYPKILARLDSRFFPEVYDLQQTGLIYYSQERFEGQSLFALFRKIAKNSVWKIRLEFGYQYLVLYAF